MHKYLFFITLNLLLICKPMMPAAAAQLENNQIALRQNAVEDLEDCPICFIQLIDDQEDIIILQKCLTAHKFHRKCLNTWAAKKSECPICLRKINKDELFKFVDELIRRNQLKKESIKGFLSGFRYGMMLYCSLAEKRVENLAELKELIPAKVDLGDGIFFANDQRNSIERNLLRLLPDFLSEKLHLGITPFLWRADGEIEEHPLLWWSQRICPLLEVITSKSMTEVIGRCSLIVKTGTMAQLTSKITNVGINRVKNSQDSAIMDQLRSQEPMVVRSYFRKGWCLGFILGFLLMHHIIISAHDYIF